MLSTKKISVVIPVFNADTCIGNLVHEVHTHLNNIQFSHEIILVDDGSQDNSWETIKKLKEKIPVITAFRLGKNFGQHKATLCGLMASEGEWVMTIDDDGEHAPRLIKDVLTRAMESDADLFYAIPSNRPKNRTRTFVSNVYRKISRLENPDAGKGSSWRVMKGDLIQELKHHQQHLFFLDEILLWYTNKVATANFEFAPSRKTQSGYTYPKLMSLSRGVFMISTTMPLTFVKMIGFSVSMISFLMGVYHLLHKIFFPTEKGYTSLILTILFSTGLILFCLGIIGEYLANILLLQNKKPAFHIRERIK